jgi:predicted DNA-binding transcriptional regulator AlpA
MSKVTKQKYRAKEVAIYLGIGLSTVWLYSKQGRLTPIRISERVTVFDIEEIEALANGVVL